MKFSACRSRFFSALLILAAGVFSGCDTLPDGEPPQGGILDNATVQPERLNFKQAQEYFVSALISTTAINCHGAKVAVASQSDAERQALKYIVSQTGEISGISIASAPETASVKLVSHIDKNIWSLKLCGKNGRIIWSDKVELINFQSGKGI